MPFGKYKGELIEKVAILDYPYFYWLKPKIESKELKREFERIYWKLNHLPVKEHCKGRGCTKPARYMSLVLSFDSSKLIDIAPSLEHVFCSVDCFENATSFVHEKATLYKIGFDAYIEIEEAAKALGAYIPKYIYREDFLPFMLKLMGFEGRKTAKNLKSLIDSIPGKEEQQRLF